MKKLIVIFLLIFSFQYTAQSNFLNNSSVFDFLDRQEVLGRITVNSHQKPYTRQKIKDLLQDIKSKVYNLNKLEKAELEYWLKEYTFPKSDSDNGKFTFLKRNEGAARSFEYNSKLFNVVAYPDVGASYSLRNEDGAYRLLYYNGLSFYSTIGDGFAFDFNFNDYSTKSDNYSLDRRFSKEVGYDYFKLAAATETNNYDRTRGSISWSWNWGYIALKKDYNLWGTGYNSKLIVSDKAPSFTHVYLNIAPADWFEFNYMHGELMSGIEDSTSYRNIGGKREHISLIPKYYVAHMATFNIYGNYKITLGESVVYSDKFESLYLVPFLFFRIADHYISQTDYNSGNAQVFAAFTARFPKYKTKLDLSVYIDEFSVANLLGSDNPERIGYTIGIENYDLFIDNLRLQIEYTRTNPLVYEHDDPVLTYENRSYQMGHWLGDNADEIYVSAQYKPIPRLKTQLAYSYSRKGDFYEVSKEPLRFKYNFLYGDVSYYSRTELYADYEIFNNLKVLMNIAISNSWGENNKIDVEDYKYTEFTTGFTYGL